MTATQTLSVAAMVIFNESFLFPFLFSCLYLKWFLRFAWQSSIPASLILPDDIQHTPVFSEESAD